ncbi:aldehyde ferredoxin oxidoreductase family protein [Chloroflexota bacterium]
MMQPIIKINLNSGEIKEYNPPEIWIRDYLGGASLAARILYKDLSKDLDPLSPEAPLLFLVGPLTGTLGPAVGRFVVCGKSPATGLWAESNCGGYWGPELRFAGYDGIWLTGRSDEKSYISISDKQINIIKADHFWGLDTYEIQLGIRKELDQPKAKVLSIGLAGENQVSFAGLFCDHGRTAGRTGLGAVLGSKNIKALAVKGSGKIPLSKPDEFNAQRSSANRLLKNDLVAQVAHDLGTAGVSDYSDYLGVMPKKYYSKGIMEGAENISGSAMSETILVGTSACHGCVVACGRVVDIGDEVRRKGPEYETLVSFGSNLLINDLKSIVELNELCDRLGLDTISTGNIIGLAYMLFEKKVITQADTDGLLLEWGNPDGAMGLIPMIANRSGIGDLMANGSRSFASNFGKIEDAVQVNGLEVAGHDPRGATGMAIVYATSPRGACHNKSDYYLVDWGQTYESIGIEFFPRQGGIDKAANVARHQDFRSIFDALGICLFSHVPFQIIADLTNHSMGRNYSVNDLMVIGERSWNLKRCINIRQGLTAADDKLPKALMEPYKEGGSAGFVPEFDEMMAAYYLAREWDAITGIPLKRKLQSLDMTEQTMEFHS